MGPRTRSPPAARCSTPKCSNGPPGGCRRATQPRSARWNGSAVRSRRTPIRRSTSGARTRASSTAATSASSLTSRVTRTCATSSAGMCGAGTRPGPRRWGSAAPTPAFRRCGAW
ncbi:hypothetical protein DK427_24810 [Methylobacterium radiodurans]|uniref:Uncharacterized protein n=1 Tax=Methylobacterium radiodurans TaxID=2202828 RepID=A0A2U8VXQ7_9HYPH|nr:hypothetical protein DK427_24810 [Methylobacterium radiodurans]